MTVLERIKEECRIRKNISITTLEQELGYSNGSLAKAKDIPSSRILEISEYLDVSMYYLMKGCEKEKPEIPDYDKDTMEMVLLYSKFNKEQKSAILSMMRSFALSD